MCGIRSRVFFCAISPVYETLLPEILEKTARLVFDYFSVQMICSVGCKVSDPLELYRSYYTARLTYAERSGDQGQIRMYDPKKAESVSSDVFDFASYRQTLTESFSEQDAEGLKQNMNQMIEELRCHPARQFQAMDAAANLLFLCISQLSDGENIISQIFSEEPEGYRVLYRMRTVAEITRWMETRRHQHPAGEKTGLSG